MNKILYLGKEVRYLYLSIKAQAKVYKSFNGIKGKYVAIKIFDLSEPYNNINGILREFYI